MARHHTGARSAIRVAGPSRVARTVFVTLDGPREVGHDNMV